MGDLEMVTMSSKGQVIVPKKIRERIKADEGAEFAVYSSGNCVIFKKVSRPRVSIKSLEKLVEESEKSLRAAGYKDEASIKALVDEAIASVRKNSG